MLCPGALNGSDDATTANISHLQVGPGNRGRRMERSELTGWNPGAGFSEQKTPIRSSVSGEIGDLGIFHFRRRETGEYRGSLIAKSSRKRLVLLEGLRIIRVPGAGPPD